MLVFIKVLHTAIWAGFNVCFGIAFWSASRGRFDAWFWVPTGLIAVECVVLAVNRWTCPLTPWAARYTDDRAPNFDIYLPRWVAEHNKRIYTTALIVAAIVVGVVHVLR
ncbi:MAG TPA: hypothetical protein RMH99_20210 [Sandaracinaceae bacterium LLY-WYZ-13_1]|nr:hypothetical protein [Sandaracinaceae bacterium LLY-WYZ-13_1]